LNNVANQISGVTTSTLALSNVQSGNVGYYTVTVKNIVGSATSNPATLALTPTTPTPPPSSGGGGGGGGGAPSLWFCGALSLLAFGRRMLRRK
jgi:hypothetical protein